VSDTTTPRPFDERAALQELEALAERIQATRRQRQEAVAEFESFVKGFREDRYQELIAAQAAQSSVPAAGVRKTEPRPAPAPESRAMPAPDSRNPIAPSPTIPAKAVPTAPPHIVPAALPRPTVDVVSLLKAPRARLALAGVGVAALVVIGAWLWFRSPDTPSQPATSTPAAQTEPPAAAAPQAVASTGPADSARATTPRALNIELITLRPVWTRVVVDGQKTIERELPKDSRIPVGADRAIAIRAGDAGAIRVTVNGKDQGVLGRDGQIAARTWTAPAPGR
jgi:hypothetical protein